MALNLLGGDLRRYRKHRSDVLPIVESLRAIREHRGITRATLAPKIGYNVHTLTKWERGTIIPSLQAIYDWCEVLGVELMIDDEPADPLVVEERNGAARQTS